MVNDDTKAKLLEAISLIENTAQNQQIEDTVAYNDWHTIEAQARDLRENIQDIKTEEDLISPEEGEEEE